MCYNFLIAVGVWLCVIVSNHLSLVIILSIDLYRTLKQLDFTSDIKSFSFILIATKPRIGGRVSCWLCI